MKFKTWTLLLLALFAGSTLWGQSYPHFYALRKTTATSPALIYDFDSAAKPLYDSLVNKQPLLGYVSVNRAGDNMTGILRSNVSGKGFYTRDLSLNMYTHMHDGIMEFSNDNIGTDRFSISYWNNDVGAVDVNPWFYAISQNTTHFNFSHPIHGVSLTMSDLVGSGARPTYVNSYGSIRDTSADGVRGLINALNRSGDTMTGILTVPGLRDTSLTIGGALFAGASGRLSASNKALLDANGTLKLRADRASYSQIEVGGGGAGNAGLMWFARGSDGQLGAYIGYPDATGIDEFRDFVGSSNSNYRTWWLRNSANPTGREVMRLSTVGGLSIGSTADAGPGGILASSLSGSNPRPVYVNTFGLLNDTTERGMRGVIGVKERSFATIYASFPASAQSIPTGTTYTKILPFNTNLAGNQGSTPDHANDRIIVDRAGTYQVNFSHSYEVNVANTTWHVAVFVNGSVAVQTVQEVKVPVANQMNYASLAVQVVCAAGDAIDVRVYHDNGGSVNLTYSHVNLSVTALD